MEYFNSILEHAAKNYKDLLGFSPSRIKVQLLASNEWQHFCSRFQLNNNSEGVFLPRNLTAYLFKGSKNLYLNLFHEYFGHGLFFEYAGHGKFLERLEKKLLEKEKQAFQGRIFTKIELQEFRMNSQEFQILKRNEEKFLALYENFAVWSEYYLSKLFGLQEAYQRKYGEIPEEFMRNVHKMIDFTQKYGELALFYEFGFPKYYNAINVETLLGAILKDRIKNLELVLLYGSRKPYSDMDLFIVSKEVCDISSEWIDIHSLTPKELEYGVSVFDIAVTDPLISGNMILGDREYYENLKRKLHEQPITREAIYYNVIRSKQQKILAEENKDNRKAYYRGLSYADTYMKNALALKQGLRKPTKKELLDLTKPSVDNLIR